MGLTQNTLGCAKGAAPCCYPGDSFSKPQRVGLRCWGGGCRERVAFSLGCCHWCTRTPATGVSPGSQPAPNSCVPGGTLALSRRSSSRLPNRDSDTETQRTGQGHLCKVLSFRLHMRTPKMVSVLGAKGWVKFRRCLAGGRVGPGDQGLCWNWREGCTLRDGED